MVLEACREVLHRCCNEKARVPLFASFARMCLLMAHGWDVAHFNSYTSLSLTFCYIYSNSAERTLLRNISYLCRTASIINRIADDLLA